MNLCYNLKLFLCCSDRVLLTLGQQIFFWNSCLLFSQEKKFEQKQIIRFPQFPIILFFILFLFCYQSFYLIEKSLSCCVCKKSERKKLFLESMGGCPLGGTWIQMVTWTFKAVYPATSTVTSTQDQWNRSFEQNSPSNKKGPLLKT